MLSYSVPKGANVKKCYKNYKEASKQAKINAKFDRQKLKNIFLN